MKLQNLLLIVLTVAVVLLSLFLFAEGEGVPRLGDEAAAAPLAATVTPTATVQKPPTPAAWAEDKSLLVNITSDDMDRAAMAISFSTRMMKEQNIPVTIFLNVEGVRLADKNIPQNIHISGKTLQEMLQIFMKDGGTLLVCPMCLENVGGMTENDLIEGAVVSSPDLIGSALFADNVRVLSY